MIFLYTNGEIIIERKEIIVEVTTENSTIIYIFRTKKEAYDNFMKLVKIHEK